MSRWFRHYSGMMRDEKLVAVAVKAKQPVERVLWVWGAILESAAEINDNGKYEVDAGEIAYFLRANGDDIAAILDGLSSAERVASGVVVKWSNRQFSSDVSASRQAAYRERQKQKNGNGGGDVQPFHSDGGKLSLKSGVTAGDGGVTSRDDEVTSYTLDTDTDKKKDKAKALSKKGTRLPNDWNPSEADLTAANDTIGYFRVAAELEKFRDYWASVPGAKGVKLDWDATWRNWVRSAAERKGHSPPKRQTYTDAANEIIEEMREHERAKSQGIERDVQLFPGVSGRPETAVEYLPAPVVRIVGRGGD
jgi:hypothetical protein